MIVRSGGALLCIAMFAAAFAGACRSKTGESSVKTTPADPGDRTDEDVRKKGGDLMAKLEIFSSAFAHEGRIPTKYTCEGDDVSPPLAWRGVPEEAASLALIVDDPDAPDPAAPKRTWVHWVLYDIPPKVKGLEEDVRALPGSTKVGFNDWKRADYGGPCPPIGRHRYFFKLYALDTRLEELKTPTKAQLEEAMRGHILDEISMIGTYEKAD